MPWLYIEYSEHASSKICGKTEGVKELLLHIGINFHLFRIFQPDSNVGTGFQVAFLKV